VLEDVDTITVIAAVIAVLTASTAYFFFARSRALAQTIDAARERIGGSAPKRRWQRQEALDSALQRLARSSSQAQRERSQLAGALQATTLGIAITDDHGVVTFANQAAGEFLGARQGEPIEEARLGDAVEQAILNRISISTEVELYTPVRRILEVGVVPLDFGVESVGAVAYIQDLTERRRGEAMQRDFIANVSHGLKTPLSALAALTEATAASLDDPQVASRMAERLHDEANRLVALVDEILDLSQAEALAGHDEVVQASALVSSVAELTAQIAEERGVQLIAEPAPAEARVSGDQRRLRTMLINLVENAVDASDPIEGQTQPRVWLRTSVTAGQVVFEVTDEGIGIPAKHINRIFGRFYRIDRARTSASGGTGLGLNIAQHVARNHGGEVTVVSTEGEGTTFTVTLPLWTSS
jgi:signal transduction histidine kinase